MSFNTKSARNILQELNSKLNMKTTNIQYLSILNECFNNIKLESTPKLIKNSPTALKVDYEQTVEIKMLKTSQTHGS